MTSKRRQGRVYWRDRAGTRRAYADFRDYADVGGKLEPLIAPGERFATTDSDVAAKLGGTGSRNWRRRIVDGRYTAMPTGQRWLLRRPTT
jgi:hypothetical protein